MQRGYSSDDTWIVSRRYSDFTALDVGLKSSGIALHLPPKKVFGNTSREFVAERQLKLQVGKLASESMLSTLSPSFVLMLMLSYFLFITGLLE